MNPASALAAADLSITKSDSRDPVSRGQNLNYTIVVVNNGPDPATSVEVEDKLPAGLDFRSFATTTGSCSRQGRTITCALGTLAASAQATVTIRTRVTKRNGAIDNTATVTTATADNDTGNNTDTERTTVRTPSGPSCLGKPATRIGTNGNNVILGTTGPDVVLALGGNDRVFTGNGKDLVCAGPGFDVVGAGPKADKVRGGLNGDRIRGRAGDDALFGNLGPDRLRGGFGNDLLGGGPGFDLCRGGPGADTLRRCP